MTERDWRVLYPSETVNRLMEGTCILCPDGWRATSIGYLVDLNSKAWAHLTCSAIKRGNMSSADFLNSVLDGRA